MSACWSVLCLQATFKNVYGLIVLVLVLVKAVLLMLMLSHASRQKSKQELKEKTTSLLYATTVISLGSESIFKPLSPARRSRVEVLAVILLPVSVLLMNFSVSFVKCR